MYANVPINGSDMTSGLSRSDKSRSTESPASSWTKADLFLVYFKEKIGGLVSGPNDKQLAYLDAVKGVGGGVRGQILFSILFD